YPRPHGNPLRETGRDIASLADRHRAPACKELLDRLALACGALEFLALDNRCPGGVLGVLRRLHGAGDGLVDGAGTIHAALSWACSRSTASSISLGKCRCSTGRPAALACSIPCSM